jgi:L-aspartate semialdehyde sulfurtransferase ferredoxin
MIALYRNWNSRAKLAIVPKRCEQESITQVRLGITVSPFQHSLIQSQLTKGYGLTVQIIRSNQYENGDHRLNLMLSGTVQQIQNGFNYLTTLNLKIKGQPNAAGDSWDC